MDSIFIKYPNLIVNDNEYLTNLSKYIKSNINKLHTSQISICFYINQVREYWKNKADFSSNSSTGICDLISLSFSFSKTEGESGYYSAIDFVQKIANISKRSYYKYLAVYDHFFKDGCFDENFKDFDFSKLCELVSVPLKTLIKDLGTFLNPKMTVKDIRYYVKLKSADVGTHKKSSEKLEENVHQRITDNGLYIKLDNSSLDYIKKVIKGKKYNYKTANDFLNALIKYAIEKELFL